MTSVARMQSPSPEPESECLETSPLILPQNHHEIVDPTRATEMKASEYFLDLYNYEFRTYFYVLLGKYIYTHME